MCISQSFTRETEPMGDLELDIHMYEIEFLWGGARNWLI